MNRYKKNLGFVIVYWCCFLTQIVSEKGGILFHWSNYLSTSLKKETARFIILEQCSFMNPMVFCLFCTFAVVVVYFGVCFVFVFCFVLFVLFSFVLFNVCVCVCVFMRKGNVIMTITMKEKNIVLIINLNLFFFTSSYILITND